MAGGRAWDVLEDQVIEQYGIFQVRRQRARSPRNGTVRDHFIVESSPSVMVVPLTEDGRVVMVEQFRHGVQRVVREFPAGLVDAGEELVDAALRELEEETGYRAASAERIGAFHTDPALQRNEVAVVVALACARSGHKDQDDGEDVATRVVDVDEVERGFVDDVASAPALAAWQLYRQWLARS
jgi:ADP-ribose pyrophosphatase